MSISALYLPLASASFRFFKTAKRADMVNFKVKASEKEENVPLFFQSILTIMIYADVASAEIDNMKMNKANPHQLITQYDSC